jgi:hypothetical protein
LGLAIPRLWFTPSDYHGEFAAVSCKSSEKWLHAEWVDIFYEANVETFAEPSNAPGLHATKNRNSSSTAGLDWSTKPLRCTSQQFPLGVAFPIPDRIGAVLFLGHALPGPDERCFVPQQERKHKT